MAVAPPVLRPRPRQEDRPVLSERDASVEAGVTDRTRLAPLLAVCGLCGGAGTSTLSYLLARFAVRELDGHILVCDTGGPTGGLAGCAHVESPRSLTECADQIARGLPLAGGFYAVDEPGSDPGRELRVVATGPRFDLDDDPHGLQALLALARRGGTQSLVVVDCGTLQRAADRLALRAASHVAWTLPATRSGLRRAEDALAAVPSDAAVRELIVARREPKGAAAGLKALKALAERRRAALALMPNVCDPSEDATRALRESQITLHAICGRLQR